MSAAAYAIMTVLLVLVVGFVAFDKPSVGPGQSPVPRIGNLWARNVSCTLATGVCMFNIENNNTASLQLVMCGIQVTLNGTNGKANYPNLVWGTVGGPAVQGIPEKSVVAATCSIPTSELTLESVGQAAIGTFIVRLDGNLNFYPAGTEFNLSFYGDWS
ncbi:MAG: hypothetical protein KGI38_09530 [Thaumarchaeota archaeon]|nr:hypothetical protein [Nitrososphaerota archaeon]